MQILNDSNFKWPYQVAIIFIAHVVGCLWYYAGSVDQTMNDGTIRKGWTRNYQVGFGRIALYYRSSTLHQIR